MYLLATFLLILTLQNPLKEPPHKVLKALKQKFPSAVNIQWNEDDNKITVNINGKIYKYVQNFESTWEANFLLGDRKTFVRIDLEGHWLLAQQEIKYEEIGVNEVKTAIKRDFINCEILFIKINNSAFGGTWYDVEGKCGNEQKIESYDYIGLPFPPKQ
jgi:hypothetical protein